MCALWLVNQLWVIVPVNPTEKSRVFWIIILLYIWDIWDVGRTLEEFVNHSPTARGLQILLVFYQHPAWFISL